MPDMDLNGMSQESTTNENGVVGTDFLSDNGDVLTNNDAISAPNVDNSEFNNNQLSNEGFTEGVGNNNTNFSSMLNDLSSVTPIDGGNVSPFSSDVFESVSFESENLGSTLDDNSTNSSLQQDANVDLSNSLGSINNDSSIYDQETDEIQNFNKYLKLFFLSTGIIILSIIFIGCLFSFNLYITQASQTQIEDKYQSYVSSYKERLHKIKSFLGIDYSIEYSSPEHSRENFESDVNRIVTANDIDYIDKRDILSPSVSNLINNTHDDVSKIYTIKQEIARQGFLPEEIRNILGEEQAIDTIQRSLNALEIIKFSTAAKVFSYMNTALNNIADMVRMNGVSSDDIENLLNTINSRGEKDISSYVYLCYLNPFETDTNCNVIGDLDLYYQIIKDNSINLKLFKNVMSALSQLLENDDTSLFSITFNGFNAQDKEITFDIEVFTNQSDEKALINKGQKNPNIFILTNIINLLKQSRFIIGAKIDTKEINVESRTITFGDLSYIMKYSSKSFTVPIQKDSEREIFDYIDLDNIQKLINKAKNKSQILDNNGDNNGDNNVAEIPVENLPDIDEELDEEIDSNENIENKIEEETINEGVNHEDGLDDSTSENIDMANENMDVQNDESKENNQEKKQTSNDETILDDVPSSDDGVE